MYKFETSIFINCHPQDVFNYVTNLDNFATWQKGDETFQWITEGPPGVGSTYKVVTSLLGRKIESELEITDWEFPNQYSFRGTSGPLTLLTTRKFEAQGEGTLLIHTGRIELRGLFKMFEGLIGKSTEKANVTSYPNLKKILEAGQKTQL